MNNMEGYIKLTCLTDEEVQKSGRDSEGSTGINVRAELRDVSERDKIMLLLAFCDGAEIRRETLMLTAMIFDKMNEAKDVDELEIPHES